MIIVFGCNRSWISRMIRWRTGSKWSHVAILDTDDVHVIEAKGGFGEVTFASLRPGIAKSNTARLTAILSEQFN